MQNLKELVMIVFVATYLLSGCATVPPASPEFERKALSFTPPSGMASVYVYRPYAYAGSAVLYNIKLDYREFGTLGIKSYLFGNVNPGPHVLRASSRKLQGSPMKFEAKAGKLYFFKIILGWWGLEIEAVEEKEGRERISNYTLSGDNVFEFEEKTRK